MNCIAAFQCGFELESCPLLQLASALCSINVTNVTGTLVQVMSRRQTCLYLSRISESVTSIFRGIDCRISYTESLNALAEVHLKAM